MGYSEKHKRIARWESRGDKYWVDLYFDPCFTFNDGSTAVDAHYRGDGCGGGVDGVSTEAEAIAAMQTRYVDHGYFQADANKTPMHRVEVTA